MKTADGKKNERQGTCIVHTHLFGADTYECSRCGAVFRERFRVCPKCGCTAGKEEKSPDWVDEMADYDETFD